MASGREFGEHSDAHQLQVRQAVARVRMPESSEFVDPMTLAAVISSSGRPHLLGDLLISVPAGNGRIPAWPLPVAGSGVISAVKPAMPGMSPAGLCQKVTLISDDCAVVWAGDQETAGALIAELRARALSEKLDAATIEGICLNWPSMRQFPASIVGATVSKDATTKESSAYYFQVNGVAGHGKYLDYMAIAGSGAPGLIQVDELFGRTAPSNLDMGNESFLALSRVLGAVGWLLSVELRAGAGALTLKSLYGGAYEVAGYWDNRFQKLGNFAYLLWTAEVNADGKPVRAGLKVILKQQYFRDTLLLQSAHVSRVGGKLGLVDLQRHAIPPMFPQAMPSDAEINSTLTYDTHMVVNCIEIRCGSRLVSLVQNVMVRNATKPLLIRQVELQGDVGLSLDPTLFPDVIGIVERHATLVMRHS